MEYNEADFVAYALKENNIGILSRHGNHFELPDGFEIEVEARDLYRLSHAGWVISPFDDIGKLCIFLKNSIERRPTNE
jgi:hypothetical protein